MSTYSWRIAVLAAALALGSSGCGTEPLAIAEGIGPSPVLPPPATGLLPTVHVAPAVGWPEGGTPIAATGMTVTAFASDLDHPRWLYVLPNGDVLIHATGDFVTADGTRLEGRGVIPDVPVALVRSELLAGRDATLEAALTWIDEQGR